MINIGFRGIVPAVILCEIERQTKKGAQKIFNMMCGSSTGAIISGGLSMPKCKYSAYDIVELY